jgi:Phosphotransferase enzyme family
VTRAGEHLDAELHRWLGSVLRPPVTAVRDRSWPDGKSAVVEVEDATGSVWFVKRHREPELYRVEAEAYRRWVPALGDRAPALRATSDPLRALVLSAVPGLAESGWQDEAVRRDGGAVLRLLHGAEGCGRCEDLAAEKEAELDEWVALGGGLLTGDDLDFARAAVRELAGVTPPERVPCHRDYTPRNWVVADRRVHLVDFEEMRPEAWMVDLGRMAIGWWFSERQLMDAVLEGYGRTPSSDELEVMRRCYLVTAIRLVVLGTRYRKLEFVAATRQRLQELRALL